MVQQAMGQLFKMLFSLNISRRFKKIDFHPDAILNHDSDLQAFCGRQTRVQARFTFDTVDS